MKTLSILLILGCAQVLSAGYYQSARPNDYYNSGYQNGRGYQGQGYYQREDQPTPYQQVEKNPNDWSQADQKQYTNPNQVNTSDWDHNTQQVKDVDGVREVNNQLPIKNK